MNFRFTFHRSTAIISSLGNNAFWMRNSRASRAAKLKEAGEVIILPFCLVPLGQPIEL